MDYRYEPMMTSRMPMTALPVTTLSTGISLTDRFKQQHQQHQSTFVARRFNDDGYGLREEMRPPHRYGGGALGPRAAAYIPSLVPNSTSVKNHQLALALARKTMTQQNAVRPVRQAPFRGKRPVQARLGIPRLGNIGRGTVNRNTIRGGVGRGGMKHLTGGRGLNQIQKSPAFVSRGGSRGRFRGTNQSPRGQRGGGIGRSRGAGGGGRGRGGGNKGSQEPPANREALDEELDSYMSNSRAYLDKQLDDYMLKAKQAQASALTGTAVIDDVTMSDVDADVTM